MSNTPSFPHDMHNIAEARTAFPKGSGSGSSSKSGDSKSSGGSQAIFDRFDEAAFSAKRSFEAKIRTDPFRGVLLGLGVGFLLAKIFGGDSDH